MVIRKKFTTLEYAKALSISPQAVVKKIHNENKKTEIKTKKFSALTKQEKRTLIGEYFPKGVKVERNCREWLIYANVDNSGSLILV